MLRYTTASMVATFGAVNLLEIRLSPGDRLKVVSARNQTTGFLGIRVSLGSLSENQVEGGLPLSTGVPAATEPAVWDGDLELAAGTARVAANFANCETGDLISLQVGVE